MTDLEYDLTLSIEWMPTQWEDSEAEVDCEETAKNLTKLGYQKIVWHDAKKELPDGNWYVWDMTITGKRTRWFLGMVLIGQMIMECVIT